MVKVAEEFCRALCNSWDNHNGKGTSPEELNIRPVTSEEVKKTLDAMKSGKAAGEDQVTTDLLKDGGQIALEELVTLYT